MPSFRISHPQLLSDPFCSLNEDTSVDLLVSGPICSESVQKRFFDFCMLNRGTSVTSLISVPIICMDLLTYPVVFDDKGNGSRFNIIPFSQVSQSLVAGRRHIEGRDYRCFLRQAKTLLAFRCYCNRGTVLHYSIHESSNKWRWLRCTVIILGSRFTPIIKTVYILRCPS